jgi:Ca2+-binding EF-hand superfamily protein
MNQGPPPPYGYQQNPQYRPGYQPQPQPNPQGYGPNQFMNFPNLPNNGYQPNAPMIPGNMPPSGAPYMPQPNMPPPNQPPYMPPPSGASAGGPPYSAYGGGFGAPPNFGASGYNPSNMGQNRPGAAWDDRAYLKRIFDDINQNHDGRISFYELHEALKRGSTTFEFDPVTVRILMSKNDRNQDGTITFDEFYNLFNNLNAQYNEFLDMDTDFSGYINGRELENSMRRRGHQYSPDIYNYITYEISRRTGRNGISFDLFVRVLARLEYLRAQFASKGQHISQLENYVRMNFFESF